MPECKRVAIIGAGPSGLTAIKSCKEEGLEPVCYERNGDPGGLWRYHDEDIEGVASVMKTTIINTSKELSTFSDFPPPAEYPNFMHNSKMFNYFMMYAENFDLLRHIRYYLEVVKVEPANDFDITGRWIVTVKSTQTEAITKEKYDAVIVCIGHHVYPKVPKFPGQEKFKGTITHTHSIKSCERFTGQRVVVVGIGNSGVDAAVDCTFVAENVYLSTRRGSWIFGRVGQDGLPFDITFNSRRKMILSVFKSYDSICRDLEKYLDSKFNHELYNIKPKHRVLSAHPSMNDALPNCILSGKIIVRGDIDRFEDNGVVFVGDETVTKIDAVILATGYQIKFPFLESSLIRTDNNQINLYKYTIPPTMKQHTLAFIGLIQPIGAIFPVAEMQCRWFVQLLKGSLKLPSTKCMENDIRCKNEKNAKRYVASTRHTIQVDWIPFMDELAEQIGVKPNLFKMFVTDLKLFWACFYGPCLPYQFRLQGPHALPEARNLILNLEKRVCLPLNPKAKNFTKENRIIKKKRLLFLLLVSTASVYFAGQYLNGNKLKLKF